MNMKIFYWMHRKLHNVTDYSLVSDPKADVLNGDSDEKAVELNPTSCEVADRDTEALLMSYMLDANFLSIGTLGHGHPVLLPTIHEEEDQLPPPQQEEEQKPTPHHPLFTPEQPKKPEIAVEELTITPLEDLKRPSCEILEPLLKDDSDENNMDKAARTTLADLFAADAATTDLSGKKTPPVVANGVTGKTQVSSTTMQSKKVVPPAPYAMAKKLHRLMKRMLKKKIHPDGAHVRGTSVAGVAEEQGCHLLPQ